MCVCKRTQRCADDFQQHPEILCVTVFKLQGLMLSQFAGWEDEAQHPASVFHLKESAWRGIKNEHDFYNACIRLCVIVLGLGELGLVVVVVWLWCDPDVDCMQTFIPTGGRMQSALAGLRVCVCVFSASTEYKSTLILHRANRTWQSVDFAKLAWAHASYSRAINHTVPS